MRGRVVGLSTCAGAAGLIAAEVAYVSRRRLPLPEGFNPSGRFGDPARPLLRIAVLGDSSTTGQGLGDVDDCWPRLIARHLGDRYCVELSGYGRGGARCREVLEDQVPRAERHRYDLAIVSVGSNDILRLASPWRIERELDEIVARMQRVASSVVLFGVGDLGSLPRLPWPVDRVASSLGRVIDRVQQRVARRHGTAKVDQWRLTTAAFNSGPHMFAPDLFHPSRQGHLAWAAAVLPTLDTELARLHRESAAQQSPQPEFSQAVWY